MRIVDDFSGKTIKLSKFSSMTIHVILDEIITGRAFCAFIIGAVVEVVLLALITSHSHDTVSALTVTGVNVALG